jgi:CO/xanthine dehydrogenase Mo-binding subunit
VDSGAEDGASDHILIGGQTGPVSCANRRQSYEAPDRAQRPPERWTPHAGKSSTVRNDARSIPRCSAGSTEAVLVEDRVRWVGDYVALVVAETVHQAADAAELIAVRYERCRR